MVGGCDRWVVGLVAAGVVCVVALRMVRLVGRVGCACGHVFGVVVVGGWERVDGPAGRVGRPVGVGKQAIRARARREASDVAERVRRGREERDGRLQGLAREALEALGEQEAAVAAAQRQLVEAKAVADQRVARVLVAMTEGEGLPLAEALMWLGGQVSRRDAGRLRREALEHQVDVDPTTTDEDGENRDEDRGQC